MFHANRLACLGVLFARVPYGYAAGLRFITSQLFLRESIIVRFSFLFCVGILSGWPPFHYAIGRSVRVFLPDSFRLLTFIGSEVLCIVSALPYIDGI